MTSIPVLFGRNAITSNPPYGVDLHLTSHGSDWLWAVFAVLVVTLFAYGLLGVFKRKSEERLFFITAAFDVFFLAIGYFTWASNLGNTGIDTEFHHHGFGTRQIFYSKYIAWFLAYPLLIVSYGVFAAISWPTLLSILFAQWVWILSALIGSLISSSYKWGFFTFGVVGLIYVWYSLLFTLVRSATKIDSDHRKFAYIYGGLIVLIQILYPIAWGLSEGGNVISSDSEAVFYGVLDLVLFVIIQSYFVWYTRDFDFASSGVVYAPKHAVFHTSEKPYPSPSHFTDATAVPANHIPVESTEPGAGFNEPEANVVNPNPTTV